MSLVRLFVGSHNGVMMIPIKPYLIRAVRDWAIESGLTPHIVVDANAAGVKVPKDHVENGRILLNIHPRAVRDFDMKEAELMFSARFAGRSRMLAIPFGAIRAVYARENGQGIAFPDDSDRGSAQANDSPRDPGPPSPRKGPHLKIVK